jgi:hypothetical protein
MAGKNKEGNRKKSRNQAASSNSGLVLLSASVLLLVLVGYVFIGEDLFSAVSRPWLGRQSAPDIPRNINEAQLNLIAKMQNSPINQQTASQITTLCLEIFELGHFLPIEKEREVLAFLLHSWDLAQNPLSFPEDKIRLRDIFANSLIYDLTEYSKYQIFLAARFSFRQGIYLQNI